MRTGSYAPADSVQEFFEGKQFVCSIFFKVRPLAEMFLLAISSTISRFIATKVSDQPVSSSAAVSDSSDPVRVILPFKDQSSADKLFGVNFRI